MLHISYTKLSYLLGIFDSSHKFLSGTKISDNASLSWPITFAPLTVRELLSSRSKTWQPEKTTYIMDISPRNIYIIKYWMRFRRIDKDYLILPSLKQTKNSQKHVTGISLVTTEVETWERINLWWNANVIRSEERWAKETNRER